MTTNKTITNQQLSCIFSGVFLSLPFKSLLISFSQPTSSLCCGVLEGSAALQHVLLKAVTHLLLHPAVYSPICRFPVISFSQLIKVCLRTPLPSSRVLRPPGRARPRPDAPRHRLILTWGPAPSTLRPQEANRGLKMPLIWEKLSALRSAQHKH